MPTYQIIIKHVVYDTYEIDAENEEEAVENWRDADYLGQTDGYLEEEVHDVILQDELKTF